MANATIHFTVGERKEVAVYATDTPVHDVKALFRAAAEAGPSDILKMSTPEGSLVNICPKLQSNTPETPYKLQVVATHCNGGGLLDKVGVDLISLEERLSRVERLVCPDYSDLPLQDLKRQVDAFRNKLEHTEHLSWLGFYKDLQTPPISESNHILHNRHFRRKSEQEQQRVLEQFGKMSNLAMTEEVRRYLQMPSFDNWQWEDEEILLLLQQMFVELEFISKFNIEMEVLHRFLEEVYRHYNDVPFHNFRHCFCVAQMMYGMAWCVDLPSRIGDLDTLILITSCICHDLDHPGFNNIYQINAKTELAIRYNDISPLENHHCSVAFRILEMDSCNIFRNFSPEQFKRVREGMIRCILATDMARHNEILNQFKEISPCFDFNNRAHINSLCMILIKVADISNEARPLHVAEPWLDRLLTEFFQQSDTEKLEGLPVMPFMDRDKVTKPSSQCSFIGYVLLPLFEALGDLFSDLEDLIIKPVRDALDHYRRLNELAREERQQRRSTDESARSGSLEKDESNKSPEIRMSPTREQGELMMTQGGSPTKRPHPPSRKSSHHQQPIITTHMVKSDSSHSVRSGQRLSVPSSTEDAAAQAMPDEEWTSDEAETEVDVSERALKFKIATEGLASCDDTLSVGGRKSRKGSRELSGTAPQYENTIPVNMSQTEPRVLVQPLKQPSPSGLFYRLKHLGGKRHQQVAVHSHVVVEGPSVSSAGSSSSGGSSKSVLASGEGKRSIAFWRRQNKDPRVKSIDVVDSDATTPESQRRQAANGDHSSTPSTPPFENKVIPRLKLLKKSEQGGSGVYTGSLDSVLDQKPAHQEVTATSAVLTTPSAERRRRFFSRSRTTSTPKKDSQKHLLLFPPWRTKKNVEESNSKTNQHSDNT